KEGVLFLLLFEMLDISVLLEVSFSFYYQPYVSTLPLYVSSFDKSIILCKRFFNSFFEMEVVSNFFSNLSSSITIFSSVDSCTSILGNSFFIFFVNSCLIFCKRNRFI